MTVPSCLAQKKGLADSSNGHKKQKFSQKSAPDSDLQSRKHPVNTSDLPNLHKKKFRILFSAFVCKIQIMMGMRYSYQPKCSLFS